jgi:NADPH2:quinone reductase
MKAIRIEQVGGPEVMQLAEIDTPAPGAGEVLVRHQAIGVNFIDTYHRCGLYPVALPSGLGLEAAGVVEAVGAGVTRFNIGDRVAYCSGPIGAYADAHVVSAERAVTLPNGIDFDIAAASLLKGMTACYLLRKTFRVERGHTIVVHAAAGGVGQIAVQWGAHLGATVIAVAGGEAKTDIATALGAHHIIDSSHENIAERVRALTEGEGADAVYDGVGKDTFEASLDSLKVRGLLVSYGNASGAIAPFSPLLPAQKGSLFLTRPTLGHYTRTLAELDETAADLFGVLASGAVKIAKPASYGLADSSQAHMDLEARKTTGSLVLTP